MISKKNESVLILRKELAHEKKLKENWKQKAKAYLRALKSTSRDRAQFAKKVTVLKQKLEEEKPRWYHKLKFWRK